MAIKRVAFGFLGTTLDAYGGFGEKRHKSWRPTVSLGLDKTLAVDRIELWYPARFAKLADTVKADIEADTSGARVVLHETPQMNPWNFEEVYSYLYDFSAGYPFDLDREEYFVHLTTGTHVAQICLFLLAETRAFPARLVQMSPRSSTDDPSVSIIDLDLSKYDKLAQRFARKLDSDLEILKAGINTRNRAFNAVIREIESVASASVEPILLLGPSGAGKSHLAKQVYALKRANNLITGQFVDVNCATIRGDQAMSILFGHTKGAFTGAASKRDGLLMRADKGLLFLDEIGELGADEQAMLLRAIEEKTFLPVGSDDEQHSSFQLIAGTNRDLHAAVRRGEFRDDLLHRINTWCFTLPPLRDRLEDLEPNLDFELKKFQQRTGRVVTFSAEARARYVDFATDRGAAWHGNFRDLNGSVIRMATLAPQGRITTEVVADETRRLVLSWSKFGDAQASTTSADQELHDWGVDPAAIDRFDQMQLAGVLRVIRESASLAEAGRKLFSVSRSNRESTNDSDRLRKYLMKFGISSGTIATQLRKADKTLNNRKTVAESSKAQR